MKILSSALIEAVIHLIVVTTEYPMLLLKLLLNAVVLLLIAVLVNGTATAAVEIIDQLFFAIAQCLSLAYTSLNFSARVCNLPAAAAAA